jgi:hypothetical protein
MIKMIRCAKNALQHLQHCAKCKDVVQMCFWWSFVSKWPYDEIRLVEMCNSVAFFGTTAEKQKKNPSHLRKPKTYIKDAKERKKKKLLEGYHFVHNNNINRQISFVIHCRVPENRLCEQTRSVMMINNRKYLLFNVLAGCFFRLVSLLLRLNYT